MGDILEQAEIDALMGDLQAGTGNGQPASGGGERYDFASQEYAVHRLIPALSLIQSQFAEAFKQRVRQWVPAVDSVRAERISVMKFGEVLRSLTSPTDITVIQAAPLGAPIYLAFEPDLVFSLVDHFFGGSGRSLKVRAGDFSPSESRFMERLSAALMPDLALAWQSALRISPQIQERQSDFRFVDELQQSDTLMVTRFVVSIGAQEAGLWSVVPWSAIDPVRDSLGGVLRTTRQEHDAQWRSRLMAGLEDSALSLVATLSESRINLKRASSLRIGDILPMDAPGQVTLRVEGQPLLTGSFGTHQGQLSVKVQHIIPSARRKA